MNDKTLEQLQDLRNRIVQDVSRSRMQDQHGLDNNSPLIRNLRQVEQEIRDWKPSEPVAEAVKLEEKKVVTGSVEHMRHALHAHHTGSSGLPRYDLGTADMGHQDYHFHHMGLTPVPNSKGDPMEDNYLVVHKHSCDGTGCKDAHHFKISRTPQKRSDGTLATSSMAQNYNVKHVAKVM